MLFVLFCILVPVISLSVVWLLIPRARRMHVRPVGTAVVDSCLQAPRAEHGHHLSLEIIERALRIAQKHVRVLAVEERIFHVGVSTRKASLEHDHLARFPHLNDGHARQLRVGILNRVGVDGVVRSHDERCVKAAHLIVDLLHLEHDVVRNTRLRQEHVQLSGHSARNGVDANHHLAVVRLQHANEVRESALRLRHRQAVAWHDQNLLGIRERLCRLGHVARHALATLDVAQLHRSGRLLCLRERSLDAKEHVDEASIHRMAHVQAENEARCADERADCRQQATRENESLGAQCPS
mmetsp:Transcript_7123/g.16243  ORF Transcript_7123/g.16243 Transcript_7123/m.16243 type:complete len:296 (-) Transcript_7123:2128-3015(-)